MDSKEDIKKKAEYCLNCKNKKCQEGCPLGNNIPEFINYIKKDKIQEAYDILTKTTVLPAICGIVCPHEKNCEANCIRGIKGAPVEIAYLESYIGQLANSENLEIKKVSRKKKRKNRNNWWRSIWLNSSSISNYQWV